MQVNFQDGVDSIYDACVAKGSTPSSTSLSDVVQGIMDIQTGIIPTGTINITSNGTKDVTQYASASVNVPNSNSTTYTATTRSTKIDLGATNTYRYLVTSGVPNSNSGTYTATTSSTKLDMGATNTYRYVNTSALTKVSGTKSITTNGNSQNVATYQYVNVNVPNSNSTTYTYGSGSTGGKVDMGAANTYRYVNAANVYAKGKTDGRSFSTQTKTFTVNSPQGDRWETLTAQCTFATKIVGFTSYDNGSNPWHNVMSISFSGNTITAVVDGMESDDPWTFNVTAIGY